MITCPGPRRPRRPAPPGPPCPSPPPAIACSAPAAEQQRRALGVVFELRTMLPTDASRCAFVARTRQGTAGERQAASCEARSTLNNDRRYADVGLPVPSRVSRVRAGPGRARRRGARGPPRTACPWLAPSLLPGRAGGGGVVLPSLRAAAQDGAGEARLSSCRPIQPASSQALHAPLPHRQAWTARTGSRLYLRKPPQSQHRAAVRIPFGSAEARQPR